MAYAIRHVTRYRYSAPIVESHLEVRMQPRSEGYQRCWDFRLRTAPPRARIDSHRDSWGTTVQLLRRPRPPHPPDDHGRGPRRVPPLAADPRTAGGRRLGRAGRDCPVPRTTGRCSPPASSPAAHTPARTFAHELDISRLNDPLTTLRELNHALFVHFDYVPRSTRVDSPIDEALESRQGVCQDFSHIMTALVRDLGIPCRYVSGYLYHEDGSSDRSARSATHAWVERASLPGLGWVGFDDLAAFEQVGDVAGIGPVDVDRVERDRDPRQHRPGHLGVERPDVLLDVLIRPNVLARPAVAAARAVEQAGVHVEADAEDEQPGADLVGPPGVLGDPHLLGLARGGEAVGEEDHVVRPRVVMEHPCVFKASLMFVLPPSRMFETNRIASSQVELLYR